MPQVGMTYNPSFPRRRESILSSSVRITGILTYKSRKRGAIVAPHTITLYFMRYLQYRFVFRLVLERRFDIPDNLIGRCARLEKLVYALTFEFVNIIVRYDATAE